MDHLCRARTCVLAFASLLSAALATGVARAEATAARPAYELVNSVGVVIHPFWRNTAYYKAHAQVKAALAELGIHHVRFGIGGAPVHPTSSPRHRNVRDLWLSAGIRSTIVVDSRDRATGRLVPQKIAGILELIGRQIGAEAVEAIEGPNEPNLLLRNYGHSDWAAEARAYQGQLHAAVKAHTRLGAVTVLTPALSPDVPEVYAALGDLTAASDAGAAHVYSNRLTFSESLERFIPRVRVHSPGGALSITEFGWHTSTNSGTWYVNETVKAKYLVRAIAEIARRSDIKRGFIYQLLDHVRDPDLTNPQASFGLIDVSLKKKHSYNAVRNMMHVLCDGPLRVPAGTLDFAMAGDLGTVRSLLLQKNSGAFYLLLWQEVQSFGHPQPGELVIPARPLRLTFNQPVRMVRTYLPADPAGGGLRGREPVAVIGGPRALAVDVPDHVLVVEIFPRGVATTPVRRSCDFVPS